MFNIGFLEFLCLFEVVILIILTAILEKMMRLIPSTADRMAEWIVCIRLYNKFMNKKGFCLENV